MIIAVNIRQTLKPGISALQATERAWSLKLNNCRPHGFVIGVINGSIIGYFRLLNVFIDSQEPTKVAFDLQECTPQEVQLINNHISTYNVNLKGVQRGKYI